MGFPSLAAIRTTYDYLIHGHADGQLSKLQSLIHNMHNLLVRLCVQHSPPENILRISSELPESPIIPLFTTKARDLAAHCQNRGYILRPIVFPTVPKGTDRVRLCIHAGNTVDEVSGLAVAIGEWLQLQLESGLPRVKSTGPKELISRL